MRKSIQLKRVPCSIEPFRDKNGKLVQHPVDQYSVQSFNLNESGFPRNDISAFEHEQNESVKASILRRMSQMRQQSNFDSRPVQEIIDTIAPNGMQSPAQFARWSKQLATHYQRVMQANAEVKAAKDAALKQQVDAAVKAQSDQSEKKVESKEK